MLKIHDLSFAYADKIVIQHLSYTFPKKGIVALMGPSGVGKTTLLHLLSGVLAPTGGEVISDHRKMAVAFQEPRLLNWLNSEENINFVLSKDKLSFKEVDALLEKFALSAHKKSLPQALSGGERQRLSLARALSVGADLLLLDEPFSALDEALAKRLAKTVQNANKEGLTIVVTHNESHAAWLGAEVLRIDTCPITTLKA